jgi:hypothetical protein
MKLNLPNAHLAIVDGETIVDYLLNPAHPDNGGKAKFFLALGFTGEAMASFRWSRSDALDIFPGHGV